MKSCLSVLISAVAAVAACPAAAQTDPGLAPSTPWNLHYDDDSCALRRTFGGDDDGAYLEMRRFGPGIALQAIVASKDMRARNPAAVSYRFSNDAGWSERAQAPTVDMADGSTGVIFSPSLVPVPDDDASAAPHEREAYSRSPALQALESEAAAKTDVLTVRGAFRRPLALRIGSLEGPIAALNTCIAELMTHWGIDVEAHRSLTRPAVPVNLAEVPRMMDYPPAMIRRSMPGIVNIRLDIDETGRITDCHIQMPLSDPAFEESSCADIQHALDFDPALDKDGNPIASYWITRVVFSLR